jgi:hypothetical protein
MQEYPLYLREKISAAIDALPIATKIYLKIARHDLVEYVITHTAVGEDVQHWREDQAQIVKSDKHNLIELLVGRFPIYITQNRVICNIIRRTIADHIDAHDPKLLKQAIKAQIADYYQSRIDRVDLSLKN